MLRFAYATIFGIIVAIISIVVTKAMIKIDEEVNVKCTSLDMIVITLTAVIAECWIAMLTPMNEYHLSIWIQSQLFIVLFEVQSCIDNKIKQVYDLLTYIVLVHQLISLLMRNISETSTRQNPLITPERVVPVLVILVIIAVITAFNGIGRGDTVIYIALGIYYINYADMPWFTLTINLFISCALFALSNAIDGMRHKKLQEHKPFTMFIQIASVFTFA